MRRSLLSAFGMVLVLAACSGGSSSSNSTVDASASPAGSGPDVGSSPASPRDGSAPAQSGGACVPTGAELLWKGTATTGIGSLSVDGDELVIGHGDIAVVAKTGGTARSLGVTRAFDVAVGDDRYYWAATKDVFAVAKTGGTPSSLYTSASTSSAAFSLHLAFDGTNVYVAEPPDSGAKKGAVLRLPPAGPPQKIADSWAPRGLAADATAAYFVDSEGELASAAIRRIAAGTASPTEVTPVSSKTSRLAVDATTVYFAEDATLRAAPTGRGAATTIAFPGSTILGLVLDGARV